ncbi:MAG: SRPBCC domain-containing protein [Sandaracinaceae bacterium]|nr:SRPBCC domain-containing protein [Sandaracinaceae bacterium]
MSTQTSTQTYETFLRATPEAVWAAMTSPEQTEIYFFGSRVALEPRVGGRLVYTAGPAALVDGEVLALEPRHRLVTTWRVQYDPACAGEVSEVEWLLEARGEATRLLVTHRLASAPNTAKNVGSEGWSVVLSGMKTLLETGKPLVIAPRA